MERLDRVYIMRAGVGALSGIISALIISSVIPNPAYDQPSTIGIAFLIAIVMFIVTVGIGRRMAPNVPKELRRKVSTDGIVPFIFVQIVVMVILYTALHQPLLSAITNSIHNSGGQEVTGAAIGNHTIVYVTSIVSPLNSNPAGTDPSVTGWLEYLRFPTTDCTGSNSVSLGNVTIVNGVAPKSMSFIANGTLGVESYYSGDSHYRGTLSGCNTVSILPSTPSSSK